MKRSEVPQKYRWKLGDLVGSEAEFETRFQAVLDKLPEIAAYAGKLGDRKSVV